MPDVMKRRYPKQGKFRLTGCGVAGWAPIALTDKEGEELHEEVYDELVTELRAVRDRMQGKFPELFFEIEGVWSK